MSVVGDVPVLGVSELTREQKRQMRGFVAESYFSGQLWHFRCLLATITSRVRLPSYPHLGDIPHPFCIAYIFNTGGGRQNAYSKELYHVHQVRKRNTGGVRYKPRWSTRDVLDREQGGKGEQDSV